MAFTGLGRAIAYERDGLSLPARERAIGMARKTTPNAIALPGWGPPLAAAGAGPDSGASLWPDGRGIVRRICGVVVRDAFDMRRYRAIAAVCGVWCGHAMADPALPDTELYATIAHGCHAVALGHWSHPTLAVLAKYNVDLTGVDLCNNETYAIYKVKFHYDPSGPNAAFYEPLIRHMAVANGYWPFAFVDEGFTTVINLNDGKHFWNVKMTVKAGDHARVLYVNYEPYKATVPAP